MITVVMPTYNAAAYIEQTIQSVINQTHENWFMIIVDDHSTDDTWKVISDFCKIDSRISAIRLEENFGRPARPRNIGIMQAKTPWVAFLDADDIWHPEKLEIQLREAEKGRLDLICSRMEDFIGEPPILSVGNLSKKFKIYDFSFLTLILKNKIPTSSVLIRKEILVKFGGFNEDVHYKAIEDYDLWLRLAAAGYRIGKCNLLLLRYRILANSISRNKKQHSKKVIWLIYVVLKAERPALMLFYPFFVISYIVLSIYYRVIARSL